MNPLFETPEPACALCGKPLPSRPPGAGRTRIYHDDCGDIASVLRRLPNMLAALDATPEKGAAIRSALLGASNKLNRKGGIRRRGAGEARVVGIASRAGGSRAKG